MKALLPLAAQGFISIQLPTGGRTYSYSTAFAELLSIAEARYGTRDLSYTPTGVEISQNDPQPSIWFPGGSRQLSIILSHHCINNTMHGLFQLAHETIHVLSPTGGAIANYLEEGLATLFADDMSHQYGWGFKTSNAKYLQARNLVEVLFHHDHDAIKKLRQHQPCLSPMTAQHILQVVPTLPIQVAQDLCVTF